MKRSLLDILRCPECKGELDLSVEKEDDEIEEGSLHCKKCKIEYPIEDGIPNMLPQED
ncbi:MAG: methytransferase partner Trm112 [Candidatus Saliniplasma sp.]